MGVRGSVIESHRHLSPEGLPKVRRVVRDSCADLVQNVVVCEDTVECRCEHVVRVVAG